jgi:phenylalanyl-tRNA synthetase beta subunit
LTALRSEASNRFEKGIPLTLPEVAIERAAALLTEIPGGLKGQVPVVKPVAGEKTDALSKWDWVQHVGLRLSRLSNFMGVNIPEEKVIDILSSLGFEVERFDFKKEARRHTKKPYVFGASFKTHGDMAFDCSYLTDYIYSRIGKFVGYTALAQYDLGTPVRNSDLRPGDILFVGGIIDKSVTDHYFIPDGDGGYKKIATKPTKVGHNAIYIGNDRIIHARHYDYDLKNKKWKKTAKAEVVEEDVSVFTKNPEYLGARRYVDSPDDFLAITVPWWRTDVSIEEDIFEEVGRIYGYEKLPTLLPGGELPWAEDSGKQEMTERIKNILSGGGFSEVINYSFVSERQMNIFGGAKKALRIANPINPEQEYMRQTLIPSLLADAAVNQDNFDSFNIFECASIYIPGKQELPEEKQRLGMLAKTGGKKKAEPYFTLKGALELLSLKLNLGKFDFGPAKVDYLAPGQSATIYIEAEEVGICGMVSEKIRHEYDLKSPVAVAELKMETILKHFGKVKKYKSISRYPSSNRDINLLFANKVTARDIEKVLAEAKRAELLSAGIIDIFCDLGLPEGQKSVTIRLVFGHAEKTLTETEVSSYVKDIISALARKLSAKERN